MNRKRSDHYTYQESQYPPQRGLADSCSICTTKFSFMKRQHQCKRCFRPVCDPCATSRIPVYKLNFEKKILRVCKICKGESDMILQYIESHGLKFKTHSETGRKWEERVGRYRVEEEEGGQGFVDFSEDMFEQLWNSFNYSLREFVGIIVDGLSPKQIYKAILEVFTAIARRTQLKIQTTPYIILMLLCFCSQNVATQIGIVLISGLKGYTPSKLVITQTLETLGATKFQLCKLEEYLETGLKKFISKLSVNMLPALLSKYILQEMIVNFNPELLIKFYCSVVFSEKERIIGNSKSKGEIQLDVIRNVDFIEVRRNFNLLKTGDLIRVSFMKEHDENSRLLRVSDLNQSRYDGGRVLSESMQGREEEEKGERRDRESIEEENRRLRKQMMEYQYLMKQNQRREQRYQEDSQKRSLEYNRVEKEKSELFERIDTLEKEKEELRVQLEIVKNLRFGHNRASFESVDHSTTRISVRNPSLSDTMDLQQLKKELGLLTSTIKQKNTRIYHLSQQNKRLSYQRFRTSQEFQELTNQEKCQSSKLETLEQEKNKLQEENERLMRILEIMCHNMMNYEEDIIASSQETFCENREVSHQ